MNVKNQGILEINIGILLISFAPLFAKFIELPAHTIIWARTLITFVFLGTILAFTQQKYKIASKKDSLYIFITGALLAVHWVTLFHSIQISSVAIGSLSMGTIPLFVSFIEPWFSKEKFNYWSLIPAFMVLFGIYIITPELSFDNNIFMGLLWGLVSASTMAFRSVLTKQFRSSYSATLLMTYQIAVVCLLLTPFSIHSAGDITQHDLIYIALLAIVVTGGGHTLMVKSLEHLKAATVSIIGSVQPAYSIVYAAILLHEIPNMSTILGGLIILCTAVFETLRHSRSIKKIQVAEEID
jgi:drug/metabolite transporter (DMT)-like permease